MISIIANAAAAQPDTLISGNWLLAVIPVVASALGVILARSHWQAQGAKNAVKAKVEVEGDVSTKEKVELVTKPQLDEHIDRIEETFREIKTAMETDRKEIKKSMDEERGTARTAMGNVHARLDKVIENQATSRGELNQINLNVQRLLDRTDKTTPRPRNG